MFLTFLFILAIITTSFSSIFHYNRSLGRGINLGNALEAPREGEWGVVLREHYFDSIAEAGFNSVRVPTRWSAHLEGDEIKKDLFDRVDWVLEQCERVGLLAIINIHHYEEIFESPMDEWDRFLNIWREISSHYSGRDNTIFFEILNEPHKNLTPDLWNKLIRETLPIIREKNPNRPVLIGLAEFGGLAGLPFLDLPEDDSLLILTPHYYEPFRFTHQGAEWVDGAEDWPEMRWRGTPLEKLTLRNDFLQLKEWSEEIGRPVNIGEFGAYGKAPQESRILWTAFVARLAESFGFSWHYWEFCSGFGAYDQFNERWHSDLLSALISDDTTVLGSPDDISLNESIVMDGDFSRGAESWTFGVWDASGVAVGAVVDGGYRVDVSVVPDKSWQIQLLQGGLQLSADSEYLISFSARGSGTFNVAIMDDKNYDLAYSSPTISPGENIRRYEFAFRAPSNIDIQRVVFSFGFSSGEITLSDIKIQEVYEVSLVTGDIGSRVNFSVSNGFFYSDEGGGAVDIYSLRGELIFTSDRWKAGRVALPALNRGIYVLNYKGYSQPLRF